MANCSPKAVLSFFMQNGIQGVATWPGTTFPRCLCIQVRSCEQNCTCQIPGVQTGNIEILLRKLRNSFVISSADCRVAYCRQTAKSTKIFLKINTKRRRERKYHVLSALMLSICIINIYLKCLEMRNDFYVIVYYPEKEQIHDLLIAFSLRCEELRH